MAPDPETMPGLRADARLAPRSARPRTDDEPEAPRRQPRTRSDFASAAHKVKKVEADTPEALDALYQQFLANIARVKGYGAEESETQKKHFAAMRKAYGTSFIVPIIDGYTPEALIVTAEKARLDSIDESARKALFNSDNGKIAVEIGSIRFEATPIPTSPNDPKPKAYKEFDYTDAYNMATAALFNEEMRKRGVVLEGSRKQRRLLKAAIAEVNKSLPEGQKIKITGGDWVGKKLFSIPPYTSHLSRAGSDFVGTYTPPAPASPPPSNEPPPSEPEKPAEPETPSETLKFMDLKDPEVQRKYLGLTKSDGSPVTDVSEIDPKSALGLFFAQNEGWTLKDEDLSDQLAEDGFAKIYVNEDGVVKGLIVGKIYHVPLDSGTVTTAVPTYTLVADGDLEIAQELAEKTVKELQEKENVGPLFLEVGADDDTTRPVYLPTSVPVSYEQPRYANTDRAETYGLHAVFPDGYTDEQKSKVTAAHLLAFLRDYDGQQENPVTGDASPAPDLADGAWHNPRNEQLAAYYEEKLKDPGVWQDPEKLASVQLAAYAEPELIVSNAVKSAIIARLDPDGDVEGSLNNQTINFYWKHLDDNAKADLEREAAAAPETPPPSAAKQADGTAAVFEGAARGAPTPAEEEPSSKDKYGLDKKFWDGISSENPTDRQRAKHFLEKPGMLEALEEHGMVLEILPNGNYKGWEDNLGDFWKLLEEWEKPTIADLAKRAEEHAKPSNGTRTPPPRPTAP